MFGTQERTFPKDMWKWQLSIRQQWSLEEVGWPKKSTRPHAPTLVQIYASEIWVSHNLTKTCSSLTVSFGVLSFSWVMFAWSPFTSVSNSAEDACKNKTTAMLKHNHTSTNGHLLTTATIFRSVTALVTLLFIVLGLGSLFLHVVCFIVP